MALVKHTRARMLFGGSCCWATVMMIGSLLAGCGGPPERWPDGGRIEGSVALDGGDLPPPGEAPAPWPYAGRIPGEYQSESNTPLRLTVAKGVNDFPIAIDSSRPRGAASGERK